MARKKREFIDSDEMKEMAEKCLGKFQGTLFMPLVDPDRIRFARITSEQAANSSDMCVEENGKDWLQDGSKLLYLVASYAETWDTWSTARKEWELLTALMKLPICIDPAGKKSEPVKRKPDVVDHKFILERLHLDWRERNNVGEDLPSLFAVESKVQVNNPADETAFAEIA